VNLLHGQLDPSHTSNISVNYAPGGQPTPWPFLCASTGVSVVIGLLGFFMSVRKARGEVVKEIPDAPKIHQVVISNASALLSTIRSFSSFGLAVKSIHFPDARHPASSSLLLLFISLNLIENNTALFIASEIFIFIDTVLVYTSIILIVASNLGQDSFYAQYTVTGGNCPIGAHVACSPHHNATWTMVGCGNDTVNPTGLNATLVDDSTRLRIGEQAIGYTGIIYGALFLFLSARSLFFSIRTYIAAYRGRKNGDSKMGVYYSHIHTIGNANLRDWHVSHLKQKMLSILFLIIIAAISLPMSVYYEQHPDYFSFIDSFGTFDTAYSNNLGNLSYTASLNAFKGGNDTRWSDCFYPRLPGDRLGFIGDWWDTKTNQALAVLAMT